VLTALKPGGRLVIADHLPLTNRTRPRAEQTKDHMIAPELVEAELRTFGFIVVERKDNFVSCPDCGPNVLWMMVAERPKAE
jgi:predicted methyltransferase